MAKRQCNKGSTTALIIEATYAHLESASGPNAVCDAEELIRTWLKWSFRRQKADLFNYIAQGGASGRIDRLSKVVWLLTMPHRLSPLLRVFAAGLQVFTAEWRANVANDLKHPDGAGRHVRETLKALEAGNADLAVTLKCEATKYGFSPDYFGYIFQNVTGVAFHQFARSLRTVRMGCLLYSTDIPIKDIIQQLGDWPIRSVIRQFHLQVGTTAGRFRALSRGSACNGDDGFQT